MIGSDGSQLFQRGIGTADAFAVVVAVDVVERHVLVDGQRRASAVVVVVRRRAPNVLVIAGFVGQTAVAMIGRLFRFVGLDA